MAQNADAMCRELTGYIAQRLGITARFVDDVPWQERERLLDTGAIDLCWICGLPYVQKADAAALIELCVAPVMSGTRYGGQPVYFSDVLVRSDSAYGSFADLHGVPGPTTSRARIPASASYAITWPDAAAPSTTSAAW